MQEKLDDALMHLKGFGEGQCFTNKAPPALAQQPDHAQTAMAYEARLFIQFQDIIRLSGQPK